MNEKMFFLWALIFLSLSVCVFSIWQVMFKWMSKEKADEMVHSHSASWTSNTKCVYTYTSLCGKDSRGWRLSLFESIHRRNNPSLFFAIIMLLTAVRAAETQNIQLYVMIEINKPAVYNTFRLFGREYQHTTYCAIHYAYCIYLSVCQSVCQKPLVCFLFNLLN